MDARRKHQIELAKSLPEQLRAFYEQAPLPPLRIWGYRNGEAEIFDGPLPEGWSDRPDAAAQEVGAPPPLMPTEAAPVAAAPDIPALRAEAESLGIRIDKRWKHKKLQEAIDRAKR